VYISLQPFPTIFDALNSLFILKYFIHALLHKFNSVAEWVKMSFLRGLVSSHVVGQTIILVVALLRPFNNEPLLHDN